MTTEDGRQTTRCRRRPPPPALERVDQQQRWLATAAVGLAGGNHHAAGVPGHLVWAAGVPARAIMGLGTYSRLRRRRLGHVSHGTRSTRLFKRQFRLVGIRH